MTVIREPEENFPYKLESWTATKPAEGVVDERDKAWTQAVARGFHEAETSDDRLPKLITTAAADQQRIYGVYATEVLQHSLPQLDPVATYASFDGTLNVGERTVPADMITAVTVRPSHRRRGLLSAMITADLHDAQQRGLPMAALTASEATIYGRFGFGEASRFRSVTVDTSNGFALRSAVTGSVEMLPTSSAADLQVRLFDLLHAETFGSISRPDHYRSMVAGEGSYDHPEPDRKVRVVAHYDVDGKIDGYVSYKHLGYESKPVSLEIIDILALNSNAYLALWKFLGEVDLSAAVNMPGAPMNDPLLWALTDSRRYRVTREGDSLWLRALDVPALLAARKYYADGELVIKVNDRLGLAGGRFALRVAAGQGQSESLSAEGTADLELDVAAFSSLYLAGVSASTLHQAGRITAQSEQAALKLFDKIFQTPEPPVSRSSF
ncbi:GNAT family N-acetyltransferase [Psychromicrobium lacuslunae]|uniref:GNAT family N-acetyltransferase n=1 Tax=Psychromicrobium lacuslunae TaxID=1618207 RepID=UPI000AE190F2|nr:GNAT family N-acetyltransferase [Psychromicrobium lacuslunae]